MYLVDCMLSLFCTAGSEVSDHSEESKEYWPLYMPMEPKSPVQSPILADVCFHVFTLLFLYSNNNADQSTLNCDCDSS